MPTLATFNANNFFLRYRFAGTYPGDQSQKSAVEAGEVAGLGYVPEKKFGQALAARVTKTHIERAGLGFDRLGAAGDLLPRQVTLTHSEDDGATPVPKKVTPPKKLDFQFERYEAILENWGNCISDHCPVKVWW